MLPKQPNFNDNFLPHRYRITIFKEVAKKNNNPPVSTISSRTVDSSKVKLQTVASVGSR